jgi:rRNA maturation RNase YbeY
VAEKPFPMPDIKEKYLGEIHLNPFYIKSKGEDLLFMLFHGLLHIAGYDHKKKNDRIRMEKKEIIIFSKYKNKQKF